MAAKELAKLAPALAGAAQIEYDAWHQDANGFDEEVGYGGICHLIADRMVGVLADHGIEAGTVADSMEVHVWVAARLADGVYLIDIPHSVYERGAGYVWRKLPDVTFAADHVVIDQLSGPMTEEEFADFCS